MFSCCRSIPPCMSSSVPAALCAGVRYGDDGTPAVMRTLHLERAERSTPAVMSNCINCRVPDVKRYGTSKFSCLRRGQMQSVTETAGKLACFFRVRSLYAFQPCSSHFHSRIANEASCRRLCIGREAPAWKPSDANVYLHNRRSYVPSYIFRVRL